MAAAAEALKRAGATVGQPDWLAPGIACDLPFDGSAAPPALPDVDAIVLASQGRRKKLLVADMESTMIHNEMLDELADFLGLREKIAGITARAMNGEIDFAGALEERVGLLKGLPVGQARRGRNAHPLHAGRRHPGRDHEEARRLLRAGLGRLHLLHGDGAHERWASTSMPPTCWNMTAPHWPVRSAARSSARKPSSRPCSGWPASTASTIAEPLTVGDGANDLPMLKAAGLGVAFHAKPAVAAEVPAAHRPRRPDRAALPAGLSPERLRREERPMTDIQQIVLAKRPEGDVTADCFRAETVALPALADGQILVRAALPVARSLHAAAHDRAALLHAALRARQAADRRLGRRGRRVEEPALRQGRHRDGHAELGHAHGP